MAFRLYYSDTIKKSIPNKEVIKEDNSRKLDKGGGTRNIQKRPKKKGERSHKANLTTL